MFRFELSNQIAKGKLIYASHDFSLDTHGRQISGVASVLINDVQIEISIDRLAIAVWGMCPHTTWKQGHVPELNSHKGRIFFEGELTPGTSIRVTQPGEYWPVAFDPSTGWLHVGQETFGNDQAIEFVEGCIAILRGGEIIGLCLHPDYQQ